MGLPRKRACGVDRQRRLDTHAGRGAVLVRGQLGPPSHGHVRRYLPNNPEMTAAAPSAMNVRMKGGYRTAPLQLAGSVGARPLYSDDL